jgi:LuxR family transcriptional regulator, maltose regulon positive regulatory protein
MTSVETGAAAHYSPTLRTTASELLVRARLHVPNATQHHLCRERLSGLLASSTAPLVLLSAPAGSGKTALAAEWARRLEGERQALWVSCRSGDIDPWGEVVRGMGGAELPALPRDPSIRRRTVFPSRVEQVLDAAGRWPLPWTVFLDGYDLRSADAADELDFLVTYAGDELQVVLTTRADPILPLHRYRLGGALLEIRAADLAFTDDEARSLLKSGGVELAPEDLHALNERLAGWAAGLRFALPTLARHPAPHALVPSAVTYNGNLNAYLVEEVLDAQPHAVRELILTTSVPDSLAPGLLEELTGEPAAPTTLRLTRANVFLESAPEDGSCLRYVPFFRDLVRAQFAYESPDRFRALHRATAAWYAGNGSWENAVTHLVHAGERPDCGAILVDHLLVGRLLCEQRYDPFRRMVMKTRSPVVPGSNGHLLLAATALADGDYEVCCSHLEAARAAGAQSDRGAVTMAVLEAVLSGAAADLRRTEQLAVRAEKALAAERRPVDPGADDAMAVLMLARAQAALRMGAVQHADRLLETCRSSATASWSPTYRSLCLAHAALLHARTGDVLRAVEEGDGAVAAARLGTETTVLATPAHVARAHAALANGDLAGARSHLSETCAPPEPLWTTMRVMVQAALDVSAGAVAEAESRLDAVMITAELAGPWAVQWICDAKVAVRAAQEEYEDAVRRLGSSALTGQPRFVPWAVGADGRVVEPLTPREVEVLAAMSEWLTTEEIADKLFVSVNTVRTHVRNILTKLGVRRRNAAIREALRLGLLTYDGRAVTTPTHLGPN